MAAIYHKRWLGHPDRDGHQLTLTANINGTAEQCFILKQSGTYLYEVESANTGEQALIRLVPKTTPASLEVGEGFILVKFSDNTEFPITKLLNGKARYTDGNSVSHLVKFVTGLATDDYPSITDSTNQEVNGALEGGITPPPQPTLPDPGEHISVIKITEVNETGAIVTFDLIHGGRSFYGEPLANHSPDSVTGSSGTGAVFRVSSASLDISGINLVPNNQPSGQGYSVNEYLYITWVLI